MNWQGSYAATSTYQSGDVVGYKGGTYIAAMTVPANTPPPAPTFWATLSPPSITNRGNWQASVQYFQNDVVSYPANSQNLYIARSAPPVGDAPTDNAYWVQLDKDQSIQDQGWNQATIISASTAGISALFTAAGAVAAIGSAVVAGIATFKKNVVDGVAAAANAAQAAADVADAAARAAQDAANAANQLAQTAKDTADTAKNTADTAKNTADTAKDTADTAKNTADAAKATAEAAAAEAKAGALGAQNFTGFVEGKVQIIGEEVQNLSASGILG
jgi:methyl-accepting chemotaxis protein